MSLATLGWFFTLTFGLSWGLAGLLVLFPDQIEDIFGGVSDTNPLFILAVYAPGIVGLVLVWRHYGIAGLASFLRRLTLWRMPIWWWILLILGIPFLFYLAAAIQGTLGEPFPFTHWYGAAKALLIALAVGPMEEFGWRGVALPLLQRRFAPLWASVILGIIWGGWHAPAFLLSGSPQSEWSFGPFMIAVVALSIILTSMFNAARGSLLVPVLFHFQTNNPAWPDAQPWDAFTFAVAAAIVVILNRRAMLAGQGAATNVLLPNDEIGFKRGPAL
jgi:membrane protease YdiL (CAAX protease family)